jgi:hypothetical protein
MLTRHRVRWGVADGAELGDASWVRRYPIQICTLAHDLTRPEHLNRRTSQRFRGESMIKYSITKVAVLIACRPCARMRAPRR